ncbi:c-type cytochrome [Emticicia sp. CRIBPO]|uniref:PVC-type heme-binding CxxCH protein n=1 Tax=Emticicia sp. CRIBPO TaxID=2683258 RepID=UPI0014129714|nr:PVC-type heme-binding CxxCH protein [Emticicia sp. CRIBPO]NBA84379.1 c-type cytochrome [Emticicia sp. CRIBPO]
MKKYLVMILLGGISLAFYQDKKLSLEDYQKLSNEEKRSVAHALDGIDLLDEDLDITLFASEPMMMNPTNMDIDQKGRVWICEAYNYRNALNPRNPYNKSGDRILIMEDTNGDGKADTSKVFYQGEDINAALGISVMGNKVFVSCSPNVFVFTDTNGDDIPDKKEILFKGIQGQQHDHGMHAFVFGPDGKLYFNHGNEGKGLLDKNGQPIKDDLGRVINNDGKPYREGMIYRSDADGNNVEIRAWNFRNNFEVAVDSYGRMWQSDNDDDGNRSTRINYVMDYGNYGFKDEITGADWRIRRTNMEDSVFHQHWHLNDPGVVPNLLQTYAGSPTGIIVYEGKLLPQKYQNKVIHCDAGPNIVRAYPTQKKGAGFTAGILNILDGSKRDQWFRPSDITVAPDGSIFVSDWYDPGVGGHAMGDSLRGRVYRIAPKGSRYNVPKYNYGDPKSVVEALQNPNLAIRYMAWNALHNMGAKAEAELANLYKSGESAMRARALWLLADINGSYLDAASTDKDEDIRVTAVRIAAENSKTPKTFYSKMAADNSVQVKREVLLAIRHKNYGDIWTQLANDYKSGDRWYLEALGVSADGAWDSYLPEYSKGKPQNWLEADASKDIVWRSRSNQTTGLLADLIKKSEGKNKLRYYRAFDFQNDANKNNVLLTLLKASKSTDEKVIIFKHFDQKTIRTNPDFVKELPLVVNAIENPYDFLEILNKYEVKTQYERLRKLMFESTDRRLNGEASRTMVQLYGAEPFKKMLLDPKVAVKAIQRFGSVDVEAITAQLVPIFTSKKYPLNYRQEAMKAMAGWNSEETLWKLFQDNKIPEDVMPEARNILTRTWHSDIKAAANKIFEKDMVKTEKVDVAALVKQKGDVAKGKEVFDMYCQTCHVVNGAGNDFGPGLSLIGKKFPKEGLYNAILYPSEGISFGYEGHKISMKDGSEMQAIITSKTENELMLKFPGSGTPTPYKRSAIKSTEEIKESLMPKFPLQNKELVDLVEYLSALK